MDYTEHKQFPEALRVAQDRLTRPEELRAKLREKSNWVQEGLPSVIELAVMIIEWCEAEQQKTLSSKPTNTEKQNHE